LRPEHPIVLITGASSGFGEATARLLASRGCHLALGARRVERVEHLAKELSEVHGIPVFAGFVDTRSTESVNGFVNASAEALGGLHVVVANAGLSRGLDRLDSVLEEDWEAMLHTNVEGVIRTVKASLPHLRKSAWGHVFFLGSTAGHTAYEGGAVYCASKSAVRAIAQTLRLELCGEPIRVTCVDPGMAETEFSVVRFRDTDRAASVYKGLEPLRAEDVAECIRWSLELPDHVNIDEMLVKCRDQASNTMAKVNRKG